jgi:hypothetical protein
MEWNLDRKIQTAPVNTDSITHHSCGGHCPANMQKNLEYSSKKSFKATATNEINEPTRTAS